tara:strand:- start:379 stop:516 length:138 start_codon:yes stop_codon:yes gene_type:complete
MEFQVRKKNNQGKKNRKEASKIEKIDCEHETKRNSYVLKSSKVHT